MACEVKNPAQLELDVQLVNKVEICVCVQDLCNTYSSNGANSTTNQPYLLNFENKATSILSLHLTLQMLFSFSLW